MISPDENYEEWETHLIIEMDNTSNYKILLGHVKKLILEILSTGQLRGKLSNYTTHFLDTNLYGVIQNLVSKQTWGMEQGLVSRILGEACKLIKDVIFKCSTEYACQYISLFLPTNPYFYEGEKFPENDPKRKKINKWNNCVFEFIKQKNGIETITRFINKNRGQISIGVYCFLFMAIDVYGETIFNKEFSVFDRILPEFIDILKNTNSALKKANKNDVKYALQFFVSVGNKYEAFTCEYSKKLLLIAIDNIKSDSLDKNMAGVEILNEVLPYNTENVDLQLIFKDLMEKNLHQSIIPNLKKTFQTILKNNKMSLEMISLLWDRTKSAHFSQQNLYIDLLVDILSEVDNDLFKTWEENAFIEETCPLLINVLIKLATVRKDLAGGILNTILENASSEQFLPSIIQGFEQINSKNFAKDAFEITGRLFCYNPTKEFAEILLTLVKKVKSEATSEQINSFIPLFINIQDDIPLYDTLSTLFLSTSAILSSDNIVKLLKLPCNDLWVFFNDILNKRGTSAFDKVFGKITVRILKREIGDIQVTPSLIEFMKNIIVIEGIRKNKITSQSSAANSIPKKFSLKSITTRGFHLLFDFFDNCQTISASIIKTIFDLISAIDEQEMDNFITFIIKRIQNKSNRENYLMLLNEFVIKYEEGKNLLDYGYLRHKDAVISDKNNILINVYLKENNYPIIIGVEVYAKKTVEYLKKIITAFHHIGTRNAAFKLKENNSYLRSTEPIKDSIHDGSDIIIVNSDEFKENKSICVPSILLLKHSFLDIAMKIIKGDHTENEEKIIYSLVSLMPTPEEVTNLCRNNMENFLSLINENTGVYCKYLLESFVLLSYDDKLKGKFIEKGGSFILKNKLYQKADVDKSLFIILTNLKDSNAEVYEIVLETLIEYDHETRSEAINFLNKMYNENINISFSEKEEIIEKILISLEGNEVKEFCKLLRKWNMANEIAEFCIDRIGSDYGENFAQLLSKVLPKTMNIDAKFYIQCCFDALKSKIGVHYIGKSITYLLPIVIENSDKDTDLIMQTLDIAYETEDKETRDVIFDAFLKIKKKEKIDVIVPIVISYINKLISSSHYKSRLYDPCKQNRSLYGSGLTNLGATCYMNSTLQQLFHLSPFLYIFMKENPSIESHKVLQKLFTTMSLTKKQASNTKHFCNTWIGWNKSKINKSEQMDANDFLLTLIDQFPAEIQNLFTGKIKTKFVNEENHYESCTEEPFQSFGVEIQECKDLLDSIQKSMEPETIPQYKGDDGKYFDVKKYTRIDKLPNVLAVQLKRFDFEMTKINSKFSFPLEMDLSSFIENSEESCKYVLNGVIIHCGTFAGGHYYSIIRDGPRWIKYNDNEVSVISYNKFMQDAEGSDKNKADRTSAYLLFYVKEDDVIQYNGEELTFDMKVDLTSISDPEIISKVMEDNLEFVHDQCIFSESFYKLVKKYADCSTLVSYFLNVFSHSTYDSLTNEIEERIESLINENSVNGEISFSTVMENYEEVHKILCSTTKELYNPTIKLIKLLINKINTNDSFVLCKKLVESLSEISHVWHAIPHFAELIVTYLKKGDNSISLVANDSDMINSLVCTVKEIFGDDKHVTFLENIDATYLFEALDLIASKKITNLMITMKDIGEKVGRNKHHVNAYKKFIREIETKEKNVSMVECLLSFTGNELESYIRSKPKKPLLLSILNAIEEGNKDIKQLIINYPMYFLKYIVSNDSEERIYTEKIIKELLPHYNSKLLEPKFVDNEKSRQRATSILNALVTFAKQEGNFSSYCQIINWLVISSHPQNFSVRSIVGIGLTLSKKSVGYIYNLLPAINYLTNESENSEEDYLYEFIINTSVYTGKPTKVFESVCTIIFYNKLSEEKQIKLLSNNNFKHKVLEILSCEYGTDIINYFYDFLETLISLRLKGNTEADDTLKQLYFPKLSSTFTHHSTTYVLLPKIVEIYGLETTIKGLDYFITKYIRRQRSNEVEAVKEMLDLLNPPTRYDIFEKSKWIIYSSAVCDSRYADIILEFVKVVTNLYIKHSKSSFAEIVRSMNNKYVNMSIAVLNDSKDVFVDILKLSKPEENKAIFKVAEYCTKLFDDTWWSKLSHSLNFAKYEKEEEGKFWRLVIKNMDPSDIDESISKLVASIIKSNSAGNKGRVESLNLIKNNFGIDGNDMKTKFLSASKEVIQEQEKNPSFKSLFK